MNDLVSLIIPARNEKYLQPTIQDILKKASGNIEIIVILDGYWPDVILSEDPRVITVHHSPSKGMRSSINIGARVSKGKYLMKLDGHCVVGGGFDEILKKDCDENTLAVPSRYGLDVEAWKPKKYKPPVEYLYLTFPYVKEDQFGLGLHGKKWTGDTKGVEGWWEPERRLKDKKIDEIMTWQGSCWFMYRSKFFDIDCLDTVYSYNMFQEAIELGFKMWLSGGRMVVNKNTWYAHWHKNEGSSYGLSNRAKLQTEQFSTWFWMWDKWKKRKYDIKWFVDKFWPIPTWPDNWEEVRDKQENITPKILDEKGYNGLCLQ